MDTALFIWHDGEQQYYGDILPERAVELTFNRSLVRIKADARDPLPANCQILRVTGCRLRAWPQLPPTLKSAKRQCADSARRRAKRRAFV